MKRRIFAIISVVLMSIGVVSFSSCNQPNNVDGPGKDDTTQNNNGVDVPESIPTPINWEENKVEATDDGVSIEVVEVENKNFKFVVRPGANVASYRLDVFPLCRLYNSLFEQMRSEGMDPATQVATAEQIEEWILSYVFNSQGAGAYTFSSDELGNDFFNKEFDWANSLYDQAKIVPGCEYLIVAVGCFDKDGSEAQAGDMSICYVATPSDELVGSPAIDIQVTTNYTAMQVTHVPNADTHYLYYWCSNESDLTPYIETYGGKQYVDFMRNTVYDAPSVENPDNLSYYVNFGEATDMEFMATAVACDVNETPAKEFQSKVFTLKQRPEDRLPAKAELSINPDYVGASMFKIDYTIERNTWALFMNLMTKEQADYYMNEASEAELKALGVDLRVQGWGINNRNYRYDIDEDYYWGDTDSGVELWQSNVSPETEYVMYWTAVNAYADIAPVQFTEPFTTKKLERNAPAECKAELNLEMTTLGVNGVHTYFTFNDQLAQMHFAFIQGDGIPFPTPEDASREELLAALIDKAESNANHWPTNPYGADEYSWFALTPKTRYVVAYVAEDWNGVLGEVKMAEATTDPLVGGPNPEVKVTSVQDEETGKWYFQFEVVKDCYMMDYAVISNEDYDMTYIGKEGSYSYWYKNINQAFNEMKMSTYNDSFVQAMNGDSLYYMAVAIGWGEDADGNEVLSRMNTLIYDKGKDTFKTLEEYYPNAQHYVAPLMTKAAMSSVVLTAEHKSESNLVEASEVVVPELAKVKVEPTEWLEAPAEGVTVRYIPVDMKRLGAHPHARMQ